MYSVKNIWKAVRISDINLVNTGSLARQSVCYLWLGVLLL